MINLKYRASSLLQYCWVIGFTYVQLYNSFPNTLLKWMYQLTLPLLKVLDVLYFLSFHFTHCVGCMSHSGFNFYFLMANEVKYLFMLLCIGYPLSLDTFSGFLPPFFFFNFILFLNFTILY